MAPTDRSPPHSAASDEAAKIRARQVKEYCEGCKARKAAIGYKAHNCTDCVWEKPKTGPERCYTKRSILARYSGVYCKDCTARKAQRLAHGGKRQNAKHKCEECLEKRRRAALRDGEIVDKEECEMVEVVDLEEEEKEEWERVEVVDSEEEQEVKKIDLREGWKEQMVVEWEAGLNAADADVAMGLDPPAAVEEAGMLQGTDMAGVEFPEPQG